MCELQDSGDYDPPLDAGIRRFVEVLNGNDVETFESCEGGAGHAYPEPTVRFHGDWAEGFRAFSVAMANKLPVFALRRTWDAAEGELVGPCWEMTCAKSAITLPFDERRCRTLDEIKASDRGGLHTVKL